MEQQTNYTGLRRFVGKSSVERMYAMAKVPPAHILPSTNTTRTAAVMSFGMKARETQQAPRPASRRATNWRCLQNEVDES